MSVRVSTSIRDSLVTNRDSLGSVNITIDRLAENQIHLQESIDEEHRATQEEMRKTQEERWRVREDTRAELAELARIVFGHVTDRDAHTRL